MNRTIQIMACMLGILFLTVAPAIAQGPNTFQPSSGSWHLALNWSFNNVPTITEDVLIPASKTCIVSGSVNAVAKSIEVETGALLQIEDGLTLQIRTPVSHTFTALQIDGTVKFTDVSATGVLLVEMTGIGEHVFQMLGDGQLIGDSADLQTTSGANVVDRIYVGGGVSGGLFVRGSWDIPIDVDNDGEFSAGFTKVMTFFSGDCSVHIGISGDGVFDTNAGIMSFLSPEFEPGGVFDGTLISTGFGLMIVSHCPQNSGPFDVGAATILAGTDGNITFYDTLETDGATIVLTSDGWLATAFEPAASMNLVNTQVTIDGGMLLAEWSADFTGVNFTVEGDGIARFRHALAADHCDISIYDNGLFWCSDEIGSAPLSLIDTDLLVANAGRLTTGDEDIRMQDLVTILVQDTAELDCSLLFTAPAANVDLTVTGGTLECTTFELSDTTLSISGGEFHVVGDTDCCNLFFSSTLTLSGGTLYLGGTFDGTVDSSVTISGGVLDIRGDNPCADPSDDFFHVGPFSFTGGKIKVAQNKTVLIE